MPLNWRCIHITSIDTTAWLQINHGSPSYTYTKKEGSHQKLYIIVDPCSEKTAPPLPTPVSLPRPAPFPSPSLIGSSQLSAKHFPHLYPSTQILGITSTIYDYEDGTDIKFRNVGTRSSDAGRLPKRHNTAFNTRRKFEIKSGKYLPTVRRGVAPEPPWSNHLRRVSTKIRKMFLRAVSPYRKGNNHI